MLFRKPPLAFTITALLVSALFLSPSPVLGQDADLAEVMNRGSVHIQAQEFDKAAESFAVATEMAPDNAQAWHLLGYSLHMAGKLDQAIEAHQKAATFEITRPIAFYNLACAWSLKGDKDKAFEYLNKAIDAGFDADEYLENDSDLDNLRNDPRFKQLMAPNKAGDQDEEPKPKQQPKQEDDAPWIGKWKVVSGKRAGEDAQRLPPEITIDLETIVLPTGQGDPFVMSYEVDKGRKPWAIDMDIESGPAPSGHAVGIIEVKGDTMKLCYDPSGQNRPDEFDSNDDNGCFLFVMERIKPKFDQRRMNGRWTCVRGKRAGQDVAQDRLGVRIEIGDGKIRLTDGEDTEFVMSYQIDDSTDPVSIDMTILSGPAPEGSQAVGIVKWKGDHLVLCYDPMGVKRPEAFESTADNGCFLFELQAIDD